MASHLCGKKRCREPMEEEEALSGGSMFMADAASPTPAHRTKSDDAAFASSCAFHEEVQKVAPLPKPPVCSFPTMFVSAQGRPIDVSVLSPHMQCSLMPQLAVHPHQPALFLHHCHVDKRSQSEPLTEQQPLDGQAAPCAGDGNTGGAYFTGFTTGHGKMVFLRKNAHTV